MTGQFWLAGNRERYLKARPEGMGWLADAPSAINDNLEWSEVYTPSRHRTYVTVSRTWAQLQQLGSGFFMGQFL